LQFRFAYQGSLLRVPAFAGTIGLVRCHTVLATIVFPAQAGNHLDLTEPIRWAPACAGVTVAGVASTPVIPDLIRDPSSS
jgi:hypothetical protein